MKKFSVCWEERKRGYIKAESVEEAKRMWDEDLGVVKGASTELSTPPMFREVSK